MQFWLRVVRDGPAAKLSASCTQCLQTALHNCEIMIVTIITVDLSSPTPDSRLIFEDTVLMQTLTANYRTLQESEKTVPISLTSHTKSVLIIHA